MTDARTTVLLVALSAATFMVTSSGSAAAPFLEAIARDLTTDLPGVAHLFSVQAVVWGLSALAAGTLSDRLGRRRVILVLAVATIGVARLAFAGAHSYAAAVALHLLSGLGGGAFMGVAFAAVSDHVPAGMRGRALSWVVTGQSLSLVLGVPLVTLLGAWSGWRGALATHATLTALLAVVVRLAVPPDPVRHPHVHRQRTPLRALLRPHLVALLAAGTTERVCFGVVAIYLPTWLQRAYGVSFGSLALALALVALGTLIGNVVGGRIADRTRSRSLVFAVASVVTAVLALPTLTWQPGLVASVAFGCAFSLANAAGRPSLLATLSDVPSELRGALFGLNVTVASMGWLVAASVGAALIGLVGFSGLGLFCATVALLGAVLALVSAAQTPRAGAH
jgi:predicted MFS family arabinose efflux permease